MQTFSYYALTAAVVLSAIGAFLLCALVYRYGFPSASADDEAPERAVRRLFVTRLGHAAAAVCFAMTGALVIVGLSLGLKSQPDTPVVTLPAASPIALPADIRTPPSPSGEITRIGSDAPALDQPPVPLDERPKSSATDGPKNPEPAAANRAEGEADPALAKEREIKRLAPAVKPKAPARPMAVKAIETEAPKSAPKPALGAEWAKIAPKPGAESSRLAPKPSGNGESTKNASKPPALDTPTTDSANVSASPVMTPPAPAAPVAPPPNAVPQREFDSPSAAPVLREPFTKERRRESEMTAQIRREPEPPPQGRTATWGAKVSRQMTDTFSKFQVDVQRELEKFGQRLKGFLD